MTGFAYVFVSMAELPSSHLYFYTQFFLFIVFPFNSYFLLFSKFSYVFLQCSYFTVSLIFHTIICMQLLFFFSLLFHTVFQAHISSPIRMQRFEAPFLTFPYICYPFLLEFPFSSGDSVIFCVFFLCFIFIHLFSLTFSPVTCLQCFKEYFFRDFVFAPQLPPVL